MKKLIIAVIWPIFFSCSVEINPIFEIDQNKVHINAYLNSFEGMMVHVTKLAPTNKPAYTDSLFVNDASVFLIDSLNGERIIIPYFSSGIYKNNTLKVIDNNKYKVEVIYKNKKTTSKYVITPKKPEDFKVIQRIENYHTENSDTGYVIEYKIQFTDPPENQFYTYWFNQLNKDIVAKFNIINYNGYNQYCNKPGGLDDLCFINSNVEMDLNVAISKDIRYGLLPYKGLYYFSFGTVSESYVRNKNSVYNSFLDDFEKIFLIPSGVYSNIENGYGLFYIQNMQILDTFRIQ